MSKAVVLLSGGMDSAVALYHTATMARDEVRPAVSVVMHFSYGQRGEQYEWQRSVELVNHMRDRFPQQPLGFIRQTIHVPVLSSLISTTGSLDPSELDGHGQPSTFVPGRNMIFISYATAVAYNVGAEYIIGGWSSVDVDYPDCSDEFLVLVAGAASCALGRSMNPYGLQVISPISALSKVGTVNLGESLGVPWELTRSCYADTEHPCLECDSCHLRTQAFLSADVRDPLIDDDTWMEMREQYHECKCMDAALTMEDAYTTCGGDHEAGS